MVAGGEAPDCGADADTGGTAEDVRPVRPAQVSVAVKVPGHARGADTARLSLAGGRSPTVLGRGNGVAPWSAFWRSDRPSAGCVGQVQPRVSRLRLYGARVARRGAAPSGAGGEGGRL